MIDTTIMINPIELIIVSIITVFIIFLILSYMIFWFKSKIKRLMSGSCVWKHTRGELLNVASFGDCATYRCKKCGKRYNAKSNGIEIVTFD